MGQMDPHFQMASWCSASRWARWPDCLSFPDGQMDQIDRYFQMARWPPDSRWPDVVAVPDEPDGSSFPGGPDCQMARWLVLARWMRELIFDDLASMRPRPYCRPACLVPTQCAAICWKILARRRFSNIFSNIWAPPLVLLLVGLWHPCGFLMHLYMGAWIHSLAVGVVKHFSIGIRSHFGSSLGVTWVGLGGVHA